MLTKLCNMLTSHLALFGLLWSINVVQYQLVIQLNGFGAVRVQQSALHGLHFKKSETEKRLPSDPSGKSCWMCEWMLIYIPVDQHYAYLEITLPLNAGHLPFVMMTLLWSVVNGMFPKPDWSLCMHHFIHQCVACPILFYFILCCRIQTKLSLLWETAL